MATPTPIRSCGADYAVYTAGASSLDFLFADIRLHQKGQDASDKGVGRMSWAQKFAILINDALNESASELGIDGYVFFSQRSEMKLRPKELATFALLGPDLFFAPYQRSVEERQAWRKSDLAEKRRRSSLCWKHQSIDDSSSVFPLWLVQGAFTLRRQSGKAHKTKMASRRMDLPPPGHAEKTGLDDTSIDARLGRMLGGFCDVAHGKLVFGLADELRNRLAVLKHDYRDSVESVIMLKSKGKETKAGAWYRSKMLAEDQVAAFIKALRTMWEDNQDDLISYERAHSWAPTALFRARADPLVSRLPPPPLDAPASASEKRRRERPRGTDEKIWPKFLSLSLLDRFQAMNAFTFTEKDRIRAREEGGRRTLDEEELQIVNLIRCKGYSRFEMIGYLPGDRTSKWLEGVFPRVAGGAATTKKITLTTKENRLLQRYKKSQPIETDDTVRERNAARVRQETGVSRPPFTQEEDLLLRREWQRLGDGTEAVGAVWQYMLPFRTRKSTTSRSNDLFVKRTLKWGWGDFNAHDSDVSEDDDIEANEESSAAEGDGSRTRTDGNQGQDEVVEGEDEVVGEQYEVNGGAE